MPASLELAPEPARACQVAVGRGQSREMEGKRTGRLLWVNLFLA